MNKSAKSNHEGQPDSLFIVNDEKAQADYWRYLKAKEEVDRMDAVAHEFHWSVVLPHLDAPIEAKQAFFAAFRQPGAHTNRKRALFGLALINHEDELKLLRDAVRTWRTFEKPLTGSPGLGPGRVFNEWSENYRQQTATIGHRFAKIIGERDHKKLSSLAAIVKAGGIETTEKSRGGPLSMDGKMLRAFIDLHLADRGLPTKKALRTACGLTDSNKDKLAANKSMRSLGLSGLPEATTKASK